jgi:hypothetical protein
MKNIIPSDILSAPVLIDLFLSISMIKKVIKLITTKKPKIEKKYTN